MTFSLFLYFREWGRTVVVIMMQIGESRELEEQKLDFEQDRRSQSTAQRLLGYLTRAEIRKTQVANVRCSSSSRINPVIPCMLLIPHSVGQPVILCPDRESLYARHTTLIILLVRI